MNKNEINNNKIIFCDISVENCEFLNLTQGKLNIFIENVNHWSLVFK
jgi:hypothetical protein